MDQSLQLKDIHLPEAVGAWPPAIGWWLLPLLLLLFAALLWWLYKKVTEKNALKSAKKLLEQITLEDERSDLQRLQQLSSWLRRVSMSVSGRKAVAGLSGDKWLQKLDESVEGAPFSEGIGRCLADAHYRKSLPDGCDLPALTKLCEQWLKGQKR